MSTGWGIVIEQLTHEDEEQRRHRRRREARRQAAGATTQKRVWIRPAAKPVVCARAAATSGSPS